MRLAHMLHTNPNRLTAGARKREVDKAGRTDQSESVTRCETVMPTPLGLSCLAIVATLGTYLDVIWGWN